MNGQDVIHNLLVTGGSTLLGLVGIGLSGLTNAWAGKVRNQALAQVIRNTDDVVMRVVKSVYQTHVHPKTRSGRRLSHDEKARLRDLALREVKQHLGAPGLKTLGKSFGPRVDTVLHHHLEAAVRDFKDQRTGKNSSSSPSPSSTASASGSGKAPLPQ